MPIDCKALGLPQMYKNYADPQKALDHYWNKRKTKNVPETYTCPCSSLRIYTYTSFLMHQKTNKHLKWLEKNQKKEEKEENPDNLD